MTDDYIKPYTADDYLKVLEEAARLDAQAPVLNDGDNLADHDEAAADHGEDCARFVAELAERWNAAFREEIDD